jgi:hypothetical protein
MRKCLNMILAVGAIVLALQYSQQSSAAGLTQAECTKFYSDMQAYDTWVTTHVKYVPLANALVADAQDVFTAACPNYSPTTGGTPPVEAK